MIKLGVQTFIVSVHEVFVQVIARNWTTRFPSLKRRDSLANLNTLSLFRCKDISDLNCNPDAKRSLATFVQSSK